MIKNNKLSVFFIGIVIYIITILIADILWTNDIMPSSWVIGQLLVIIFFFSGIYITYKAFNSYNNKQFINKLIWVNIIFKIVILIFTYYYFKETVGIPILSHSDPYYYYTRGLELSEYIKDFQFNSILLLFQGTDFADIGGVVYYGSIYLIFGNNIFMAGIVNIFFTISSIVIFYKIIIKIHSDKIAKLSTIIMSFIPVFNLYLAVHLKEIIFVWIILKVTLSIIKIQERFSIKQFIIILILTLFLFAFRTTVAYSLILSLLIYYLFNQQKKSNIFQRLIFMSIIIFVFFGIVQFTSINNDTQKIFIQTDKGANSASSSVLNETRGANSITKQFLGLPVQLVLTSFGPIPTIIDYKMKKEGLMGVRTFISDGFVKNFLAFFFIIGIFNISTLKNNIFVSSFLITNFAIISIAAYGLSYRFFLPILPFFIYFVSIGIFKFKKYYFLFFLYLILIIAIVLFFNYTKLVDFNLV